MDLSAKVRSSDPRPLDDNEVEHLRTMINDLLFVHDELNEDELDEVFSIQEEFEGTMSLSQDQIERIEELWDEV